jgi:MYXO-CTERM domain-containing protein
VDGCQSDNDCANPQRCCGPSSSKVCVTVGAEVCDGKDNDCDGQIDNGIDTAQLPLCSKQEGVCAGSRSHCTAGQPISCTETEYLANNSAYQATETRCDGKDNDCNGKVDEPASCTVVPADAGEAMRTYNLGGCGCSSGPADGSAWLWSLAVLGLAVRTGARRRG